MQKKEFYYKSADGETEIHACMWQPEMEPVGVIQIAHGVTEYILRYSELAEIFVERGYVVVGNDHIGHGKSVAPGKEKMYFGKEGSWSFVVDDIKNCVDMTKEMFPNIPYIIIGFSLGSFLVRTYLIKYPGQVNGAILMGTGQIPAFPLKLVRKMVVKEAEEVGEDHTSKKIHDLSFGTYNKKFAPNKTDYDWLCSNEDELKKYIEDPSRGGDFTAGLFREMLDGMLYTSQIDNMKKMDKDMPILILSGDKDPVGDFGKGVNRTYKALKKAGIEDVKMQMYHNARHDILHEDCTDSVKNDIYSWIKTIV